MDSEQSEIENERDRETEELSMLERLREIKKEIFKRYGSTVTAVVLAVGTTIGLILRLLSKGRKEVANGVGNGFQNLGWACLARLSALYFAQPAR